MSISSYQVDNVLKAYSKQNKAKAQNHPVEKVQKIDPQADIVSISREKEKPEIFDKISYSLRDLLIKTNKSK
ncbi:MAG TPA: hypothetical protein P5551_01395 [Syntrophales bacterium]|jgi:hypothetical protein|nr:hypothetical protein [Syntrophales bacterium]HRT61001.1 hypothetical protein [Syntrophales bacterium]